MESCDVVYHCAGLLEIWKKEDEQHAVNVDGTREVVDACRRSNVNRLVHIIAAAVISDGKPVRNANEQRPIPRRPFGAYARTKAEAEKIVLAANNDQLVTVALGPPAIWGAGDVQLLPEILKAVRKRQFVWINGGRYPYDTCHVRNLCEAAILAATATSDGQAYFLTDGNRTSFKDFIYSLLETQGVRAGRLSITRIAAWSSAMALESVYRLLGVRSNPPITRVMLALIGGAIEICDNKDRRELGYIGRVTRQEGINELQI
jgi:nucleoside-diphosphate-sugar epimerase